MDDTRSREFFCQPINPYQRRYEALRAVFVEGRSQKEVAEGFGFEQSSLRQLVYEFRAQCSEPTEVSPFFGNSPSDDQLEGRRHARKETPRTRFPTLQTAGS